MSNIIFAWPFHSFMYAAEHTIHFTKLHTNNTGVKLGMSTWAKSSIIHNCTMEYIQHGRQKSGFIFEMRKFTMSIYYKKVKQIDLTQKRLKKLDLENRSWNFRSEISKMRRKINKLHALLTLFLIMCLSLFMNHYVILLFYPQILLYFHHDPKTKVSVKDTSAIRNHRGIALSRLRPKVFDGCIISLNSVVLRSNHLQFAYKNRCSTIQCVSMVIWGHW